MIQRINFIAIIMTLNIMAGCASNYELVKAASSGTRQDVFQEIPSGDAPQSGYADLHISSSLKTHHPGSYSGKDIHGTAEYKIIVNIDGQIIDLLCVPQKENNEVGSQHDPEAGEGMRYRFSKNIRIKAGPHKAVIAIPADGIAIEREITLTDGSSNTLTLEPVYRAIVSKQRPVLYGATSFREGLKGIKMILNRQLVADRL